MNLPTMSSSRELTIEKIGTLMSATDLEHGDDDDDVYIFDPMGDGPISCLFCLFSWL